MLRSQSAGFLGDFGPPSMLPVRLRIGELPGGEPTVVLVVDPFLLPELVIQLPFLVSVG